MKAKTLQENKPLLNSKIYHGETSGKANGSCIIKCVTILIAYLSLWTIKDDLVTRILSLDYAWQCTLYLMTSPAYDSANTYTMLSCQ